MDAVVRVTDGDTVRVLRSRTVELDGRRYRLADDPATEPRGVSIRLVWVDTPERGDNPGWETARADLTDWLDRAAPRGLRVVCYASAGWDRLLGDFLDADGGSASQWLMTQRGWPPYVADKPSGGKP